MMIRLVKLELSRPVEINNIMSQGCLLEELPINSKLKSDVYNSKYPNIIK